MIFFFNCTHTWSGQGLYGWVLGGMGSANGFGGHFNANDLPGQWIASTCGINRGPINQATLIASGLVHRSPFTIHHSPTYTSISVCLHYTSVSGSSQMPWHANWDGDERVNGIGIRIGLPRISLTVDVSVFPIHRWLCKIQFYLTPSEPPSNRPKKTSRNESSWRHSFALLRCQQQLQQKLCFDSNCDWNWDTILHLRYEKRPTGDVRNIPILLSISIIFLGFAPLLNRTIRGWT